MESENDKLKSNLAVAEYRIELLESENKSIKSQLTDLENTFISEEILEEILEDIEDGFEDLKASDDIIKSDLTRLSIEQVEMNKRLDTFETVIEDGADRLNITELEVDNLQDKYDLLSSQNKIFESSIETIEARLDILEKNAGKGILYDLKPSVMDLYRNSDNTRV